MDIAKDYKIKLISKIHLANDYYSFDFEKPNDFVFTEGQFGIFKIESDQIQGRNTRAFSIASSGAETFIRIATKIIATPSDFKKVLRNLALGDEIMMTAPKGSFTFEYDQKAVLIAGGIGITPIRSMLFSAKRKSMERNDFLIYSELDKCYPFHEEIEKLPGLEIEYAADIAPTQKAISDAAKKYENSRMYYLSGSPGFVNALKGLLEENGVTEEHIKHDVFIGY